MNQALGFIKPHAAASEPVWQTVKALLETQGIRVHSEVRITGPEIRKAGLIDQHYAVIARIGTCPAPQRLSVDPQGLKTFSDAFGISWTDALAARQIVSGAEAATRFKLAAPALMELWMTHQPVKLGGGFYAAYLPAQNAYILNGFYPSIRDIYTAESALIRCFLVDFDEASLPWHVFRDDVIGATDPARAVPGSIRGHLFRDCKRYGLSLDFRDNVIHASASPIEAVLEKSVWLPGYDPSSDPLFQRLAPHGWEWKDLVHLGRKNPHIPINDKSLPLIDAMENRDTPYVAEWIQTQVKD
jgi:hypothetical protein